MQCTMQRVRCIENRKRDRNEENERKYERDYETKKVVLLRETERQL